jgi:hypothetical protein
LAVFHRGHVDPTREYDPVSTRTAARPYFQKLIEIQRATREGPTGGTIEEWDAKATELKAQRNALFVIRAQQEATLSALDSKTDVAF